MFLLTHQINVVFCFLFGFRAWFILQHLRGYRPFITKVTFYRTFEGDLNDETN
jgi:hypothetical protein